MRLQPALLANVFSTASLLSVSPREISCTIEEIPAPVLPAKDPAICAFSEWLSTNLAIETPFASNLRMDQGRLPQRTSPASAFTCIHDVSDRRIPLQRKRDPTGGPNLK